MLIYVCDPCAITRDRPSVWENHKLTEKHKNNVHTADEVCNICGSCFIINKKGTKDQKRFDSHLEQCTGKNIDGGKKIENPVPIEKNHSKEIIKLTNKIIEKDHEILRKENNSIKEKISEIKINLNETTSENKNLINDNNLLKNECQLLKDKINFLNDENKQIMIKCDNKIEKIKTKISKEIKKFYDSSEKFFNDNKEVSDDSENEEDDIECEVDNQKKTYKKKEYQTVLDLKFGDIIVEECLMESVFVVVIHLTFQLLKLDML